MQLAVHTIGDFIYGEHSVAVKSRSNCSRYSVTAQAEEQATPSLSEAEDAYLAAPGGCADISHLQAERQRSRMRLSSIARLEQVSDHLLITGHHGTHSTV